MRLRQLFAATFVVMNMFVVEIIKCHGFWDLLLISEIICM